MDLSALGEILSGLSGNASNKVDAVSASIRQAENGYVVTVAYPPHMIRSGPPPHIQKMMEGFSKVAKKAEEGTGEGLQPSDVLKVFMSSMEAKEEKPLRKPVEEYVFPDIEKMLAFLKETFGA